MIKKAKIKTKRVSKVTVKSQVTTLSLKFYFEQLLDDTTRILYRDMKAKDDKKLTFADKSWISSIEKEAMDIFSSSVRRMNSDKWEIYAVLHNRDLVRNPDDMFEVSYKKPHIHVYVRRMEYSESRRSRKRFRVSTVLRDLDLNYNSKEDTKMWDSRGAEIIKQPFENSIAYAMHETRKAKSDGKEPYSIEDVITNQPKGMVEYYLKKYKKKCKKVGEVDWDDFAEECYELGLRCGDISAFFDDRISVTLQTSKQAQFCRKKYEEGLAEGITRINNLTRVSILIHGESNTGKTENARKALLAMGKKVYVAPRGTGKYDGVKNTTDGIIFDDTYPSDIRNVMDNRAVVLHRRNSGDRPWLGDFAIATTNVSPTQWIYKCLGAPVSFCMRGEKALEAKRKGEDYYSSDLSDSFMDYYRMKQSVEERLYICTVAPDCSRGQLVLDVEKEQTRGDRESRKAHARKFLEFKSMFDDCLSTYDVSDEFLIEKFGYNTNKIKAYRYSRKRLITNEKYYKYRAENKVNSRAHVFVEIMMCLYKAEMAQGTNDSLAMKDYKRRLVDRVNANPYIDGTVKNVI